MHGHEKTDTDVHSALLCKQSQDCLRSMHENYNVFLS